MSLLNDYQIAWFCQSQIPLVSPFDATLLNGASLNIRVGNTALIENYPSDNLETAIASSNPISAYKPTFTTVDLTIFSETNPYLILPNEFLLVASLEIFNLPDHIMGDFRLRSTFARLGFDQSLAAFLEPGWSNSVLTMELRNNLRFHNLPLYPGMIIGQVLFQEVKPALKRKYSTIGHYNNDLTVQEAKL